MINLFPMSIDLSFPTPTGKPSDPLYKTQMIGRAQDLYVREHPGKNFTMEEVMKFARDSKMLEKVGRGQFSFGHRYTKKFLKKFA